MLDKAKLRIPFNPLRLILVLAIGCTTATKENPPGVDAAVEFAMGPGWPPEWSNETTTPGRRHWFREGEDIENWQDSVVVGTNERAECGATPRSGMEGLRASLEQECPNAEWNVIEEDGNSVLWEWWQPHACHGSAAQHEIVKVIFGRCGCAEVQYRAKGGRIAPDRRAEWVEQLSEWELQLLKPGRDSKKYFQLAEHCLDSWVDQEPLQVDCFEEIVDTERFRGSLGVPLKKGMCLF